MQLGVARNQRRRYYKGVAKVTTRRARKGFELKFNPDKNWSSGLYRNLNFIQYADGTDITNINHDDASWFCRDTHSKHGTASVLGNNVLTTHTDYVNKYPSLLQTTSYNFSTTKTTKEACAGVVWKCWRYSQRILLSIMLISERLSQMPFSEMCSIEYFVHTSRQGYWRRA